MSAICGQIPSRRTNSFRFFFFNEFDFIALGPLITRARSESKLQASERPRDLPCLVQGSRTLPPHRRRSRRHRRRSSSL